MSNNPLRHLYSTKRWRQMRAAQLAREPLCRYCQALGQIVAATVCDHVIPHRGDVVLFWTGELQSTCKSCHDGTKQQLEKSGVLRGCGVDGKPFGRSDW